MHALRNLTTIAISLALTIAARAELPTTLTFQARDTLGSMDDPVEDARECLAGLAWEAGAFDVTCTRTPDADYDWLVRFPSPVTSGNAANDRVALEWYVARDESGQPRHAPAVIVVHETGSDMIAGRLFARSLRVKGIHALMVQLPFYGQRRGNGMPRGANVVTIFKQGVADIRRARDAAAVLPDVDTQNIDLQGTSLGGFAAALAGSLDGAFDHTFLTLAGGNLYELVQNDHYEVKRFRRRLEEAGYRGDKLKDFFWQIEPLRIAHRLDPHTTWMYQASEDQVVPAKYSDALAAAVDLPAEHRLAFPGDHYTVFIYFPKLLDHMVARIVTP